MSSTTRKNQALTKKAVSPVSRKPKKKAVEPVVQKEPKKKKSSTILGRLGKSTIKNHWKLIAKIALGTSLALWGYKQLNRSKEEVKADSKVIREEKIPEQYPVTPETPHNDIRKESADLGSRVAEWALTGEYPSKPAEQVHQEAEEIRGQIDKKEAGVRKKSANMGSRFAEWLKGGKQQ